MQAHIQNFEEGRVAPTNEVESDLAGRTVLEHVEHNYGQIFERKFFTILVDLRMHEMVRCFLMFLLGAFRRCPLLMEFCEKTIASGSLEEQTWERLRLTLDHACDFFIRFADILRLGSEFMVAVNTSVCKEANFAGLGIRVFF